MLVWCVRATVVDVWCAVHAVHAVLLLKELDKDEVEELKRRHTQLMTRGLADFVQVTLGKAERDAGACVESTMTYGGRGVAGIPII